jgi:hypothetical protein
MNTASLLVLAVISQLPTPPVPNKSLPTAIQGESAAPVATAEATLGAKAGDIEFIGCMLVHKGDESLFVPSMLNANSFQVSENEFMQFNKRIRYIKTEFVYPKEDQDKVVGILADVPKTDPRYEKRIASLKATFDEITQMLGDAIELAVIDVALVFKITPNLYFYDDDEYNEKSNTRIGPGHDTANAGAILIQVGKLRYDPKATATYGTLFIGRNFAIIYYATGKGEEKDSKQVTSRFKGVIAHEFGHLVQTKEKIELPPMPVKGVLRKQKPRELFADFISGWYIGHVNRNKLDEHLEPATVSRAFELLGDTNFGSKDHHGTAEERKAAFDAGLSDKSTGVAEAAKAGEHYVRSLIKPTQVSEGIPATVQ